MSASSPLSAPGAQAQGTTFPERLKRLSEELRCLVCQNQTLADSNADLAVDLKRQIETLLEQGQSDGQILDYMVARYGDFVLYRPPLQSNTWLLWFGPFAMLAGGGLLWWLIQRRNRLNRPVAGPSAPATTGAAAQQAPEAMARARALLDR
jgi:cytochrome c-type biogenesis protein CcmH